MAYASRQQHHCLVLVCFVCFVGWLTGWLVVLQRRCHARVSMEYFPKPKWNESRVLAGSGFMFVVGGLGCLIGLARYFDLLV